VERVTKIFKTDLAISGDPALKGQILRMDTIKYKDMFWLVGRWALEERGKWITPELLICLSTLAHQKSPHPNADFILNEPIPKAVLDGQIPKQLESAYDVVEYPEVKVRNPLEVN